MRTIRVAILLAGFLAMAAAASAQTPTTPDNPPAAQTATTQPPPTPAPSNWTHWGTDFSLMFDGYVDANFNDPASGFNGLRNFDVRANNVHLGMGMLTIDHAPGPVGFHLDAGFGEDFDIIHAGNRDPEDWKYVKQAYVSFKPKSWHGVEVDAGEFVTSAGAEVITPGRCFSPGRFPITTSASALHFRSAPISRAACS